ncbi:transposase [Methylobacterium nodulans]
MAPLAACFPRPTFANLMVLVAGAVLAPGRRTVTAALSRLGLREGVTVSTYHRVLSRRRWRAQATARGLLGLLIAAFAPSGPVVVGIDETLERRWGARIKARGIDRDPVRSSPGHFVKASGLRWISRMLPHDGVVGALNPASRARASSCQPDPILCRRALRRSTRPAAGASPCTRRATATRC